jgi:DNA-binding NarL/FixJ family response regulator
VATQKLTAREERIYRSIASGLSSREAAARLGIAAPTVESQLAKLYEKPGIKFSRGTRRALRAIGELNLNRRAPRTRR